MLIDAKLKSGKGVQKGSDWEKYIKEGKVRIGP
jgi:hypothetical protein